jgi:hypothetical protein
MKHQSGHTCPIIYNGLVLSVKIRFVYSARYDRITIIIGYIWPNTIHCLTLSDVDLMNDISGIKGEYRCPTLARSTFSSKLFVRLKAGRRPPRQMPLTRL